jgi:hypothetical protein
MSLRRVGRMGINNTQNRTNSLFTASGIPGPIINPSSTIVSNNQVNLSWSAPTNSGESPITSYSVIVSPSQGSVVVSGTTASITGLTRDTDYTFKVIANSSVGAGLSAFAPTRKTTNWNEATGGTVTSVPNYNGTGQTWKVHSFSSSSDTFTVVNSTVPFNILAVGAGGSGGPVNQSRGGGGGGGGAVIDSTYTLSLGAKTVQGSSGSITGIVAAAGGGGGLGGGTGTGYRNGGTSGNGNLGGFNSSDTWSSGGGGGSGGVGGNAAPSANGPGGAGTSSSITGSSVSYGYGGMGGTMNANGSNGAPGIVVIAYRTN